MSQYKGEDAQQGPQSPPRKPENERGYTLGYYNPEYDPPKDREPDYGARLYPWPDSREETHDTEATYASRGDYPHEAYADAEYAEAAYRGHHQYPEEYAPHAAYADGEEYAAYKEYASRASQYADYEEYSRREASRELPRKAPYREYREEEYAAEEYPPREAYSPGAAAFSDPRFREEYPLHEYSDHEYSDHDYSDNEYSDEYRDKEYPAEEYPDAYPDSYPDNAYPPREAYPPHNEYAAYENHPKRAPYPEYEGGDASRPAAGVARPPHYEAANDHVERRRPKAKAGPRIKEAQESPYSDISRSLQDNKTIRQSKKRVYIYATAAGLLLILMIVQIVLLLSAGNEAKAELISEMRNIDGESAKPDKRKVAAKEQAAAKGTGKGEEAEDADKDSIENEYDKLEAPMTRREKEILQKQAEARSKMEGQNAKDGENPPPRPSKDNPHAKGKLIYRYYLEDETFLVKPLSASETGEAEEADKNVVLYTFDDAPVENALNIAKACQAKGVKAIFFVNGHFLETEKEKAVLRELYDMGFTIGNHTYTHPKLRELSYEEQKKEIAGLNDLIEKIIGERPRFFRPPFGQYNLDTLKICEEEKMELMTWTYGYDWKEEYCEGKALAKAMVESEYLSPGANLLMHDRQWTYDAISDIIDGLAKKGYKGVDPREIKSP